MPESEAIFSARLGKNCFERNRTGSLGMCGEIKIAKGRTESFAGVFEVRCAGANFGPRGAHGAGRDKGLAAIEMETDPAESSAYRARAIGRDLQGVSAAEIDGHGRRSVDDEFAGRSPDHGVNGTDIELNAFAMIASLQETNAGVGLDLNFAEVIFRNAGPRSAVRFQSLANAKFCGGLTGSDELVADLW